MEINVRAAIGRAKLYGILDLGYVNEVQALATARAMLEGGVQILQLRAKNKPVELIVTLGRELAHLCRGYGVPFVLNDYPALVKETGADGVHVGQDDLSVAEARELSPANAIIGKSTHSLAQAVAAQEEGADYIGFGPLFATATKPDYQPIGLAGIAEACRRVSVPIFCIGGIKRENLVDVLAAGAQRIVIVSGILLADDISAYCRNCLAAFQ